MPDLDLNVSIVRTCKVAFSVSSSRIISSSSWRCSASISAIKVSGESGTAEMRSPLCNFWQYCAIKECSSVKIPPPPPTMPLPLMPVPTVPKVSEKIMLLHITVSEKECQNIYLKFVAKIVGHILKAAKVHISQVGHSGYLRQTEGLAGNSNV